MRRFHSIRQRALVPTILCTSFALATIAGCAYFNPYDHKPPTLPKLRDGTNSDSLPYFAGDAQAAFEYAELVRQSYFDNLKYSAVTRNWTAVGAAVLSAKGLYTALKPNSGTDGDKRMLARVGVALGTLYGLRQFFVNSEQEAAYVEGYTALTCLMLESGALLMTARSDDLTRSRPGLAAPAAIAAASSDVIARNNAVNFIPALRNGEVAGNDVDRFQYALDALETKILQVNLAVAADEARADTIAGDDGDIKSSQAALRKRISQAKAALTYARHALSDGRTLLDAVRRSGQTIEGRVGIIMGSVNGMLQTRQHDLGKAEDNLKNAKDISSSILNIGGNTAADQTQVGAPSQGASWRNTLLLAGPMTTGVAELAATQFLAAAAGLAPAAASSAASSASSASSPRAGSAKKPTKSGKGNVGSAVPTVKDLETIRDSLNAAIKELNDKSLAEEQAKRKADLEKQAAAVAEQIKTLNKGAPYCSNGVQGLQACTVELALDTEGLYAARRPVAQAVLNFRKQVREATDVPTCQALAPLRVSPNEAKRLYAGESATFTISQRATGNPFASLDGPDDKEKGVTSTFTPVGGGSMYQAKVTVAPQMLYSRTVQLVVSDSTGVSRQLIPIFAGGVAPGASAPTGSASSPPSGASSPASAPSKGASATAGK